MIGRRAPADPGATRTGPGATRFGDDRGVTLIEVVTAMSIMSILMVIFTGGILEVYRFANRSEAAAAASTQLNIAFMRLDKEVRYASGISTPGTVGVDHYVEYLITNTGTPVCVELRLDVADRQLQRRTWVQGSPPGSLTAWTPLTSGVSGDQPFTTRPADATFSYQRLTVTLTADAGSGSTARATEGSVTFTALNTSFESSTANVCTEGRTAP